MPNQNQYSSDQDRSKALAALGEKLKAARPEPQTSENEASMNNRSGWAIGVRYASEFAAAVIVGGVFGYGIDHFAGSTPWGLIGGMVLGFVAGTYSMVRLAGQLNADAAKAAEADKE